MKSIEKTDILETDFIYECIIRSAGIYYDGLKCIAETDILTVCSDDECAIMFGFEI